MAGFSERRGALTDTAFAMFGEPADWQDIAQPVLVRFASYEERSRFSETPFIANATLIRVRRSEVPDPTDGQIVTIADGSNAGTFRIAGEPLLDRKAVWNCDAVRIA